MPSYPLAAGFITAVVAVAGFTPLVILLANRCGWLAMPRADRWSQRPTALMGGIAIYLGTMAGALAAGEVNGTTAPLWIGASAMFALGLVDDRLRIRPPVKLVVQIAAACWLIAHGIRFERIPLPWTVPVTLLWIIGITNAVNLLDNMDGLAAGVTAICAVVTASYGMLVGNAEVAALALPLAGACLGFLLFNFKPARIFMGDCGSMFLGFTLSGIALLGTHRTAPNILLALLAPAAILAVPIFDTTLVTFARRVAGRPVSEGGRDHSSHRLVALGLSERDSVLMFYGLSAAFGALALVATQLPGAMVAIAATLMFLALGALGVFLGMVQVYPARAAGPAAPERTTMLGGVLQYKKQLAQVLVDVILVPVAYYGAYLLRFEGNLPPPVMQAVTATLPFLLAIKLVALAISQSYNGVWRYAGMSDVLNVTKASTMASLVAALMIGQATGFRDLSRSAFFLDWLLFTNLAIAARTGLTALRHVFAVVPNTAVPRVLIVGASGVGVAAAQALVDPTGAHRAAVVGFLDDDPAKQHRTLNGVPVLGFLDDLPVVLDEEQIDSCLVALVPGCAAAEHVTALCEREGLPYSWATPVTPSDERRVRPESGAAA
jgi:UDP-GlcNAc:undecaprenyl-phosphate GlcNAc-1-phosphate transferase